MKTRYFALIFGIIYTVVGVLGFFPGLLTSFEIGDPDLIVGGAFTGYLFGLFPVNWLHSIVHLALGLWGIAAYRSYSGSRTYAKSLAVIFGILAVMGFIPVLWSTFGLIPLWGNDIWLHAGTAIIAAYFGWSHGSVEVEERERERRATTTETTPRR